MARGDQRAASTESRCTKHRGIEHRFKPHYYHAMHPARQLLPPVLAVTTTPEAKFVAKLLRTFPNFDRVGHGFRGVEIAIEVRSETHKGGARDWGFHQIFSW